jgi:uncharacterized protein (TIGR02246 family)
MKYLLLPLFLLLGACVRYVPADAKTDEQEIRRLLHDTEKQFAAGNFDAALRFYSTDAVLMMPGKPPVRGNLAIRNNLARAFAEAKFSVVLEVAEVRVSRERDMAYVYGTAKAVAVALPSEASTTNWLAVFVRQTDGSFRVVADMFNAAE